MIEKIAVENFRIFKDLTEFDIQPITLLIGPNNSGKSSLLKILDTIKTSIERTETLNYLLFNKVSYNVGDFHKNSHFSSKSNELIKIVVNLPLKYFNENFDLEIGYGSDRGNGTIKSFKIFNENRVLYSINTLESKKLIFSPGGDYVDCSETFDFNYLKKTIK